MIHYFDRGKSVHMQMACVIAFYVRFSIWVRQSESSREINEYHLLEGARQ